MTNWKYHINIGDIWNNDDLPFEEKRDAIQARVASSSAYRQAARLAILDNDDAYNHEEFINNVECLSEAQDEDEFDEIWSDIYDYCDYRLIWIDLWKDGDHERLA